MSFHFYLREIEEPPEEGGEVVYIVDYDIPTNKRQLFYYHLRRRLAEILVNFIDYEEKLPTMKEILAAAEAQGIYVHSTSSVIRTSHKWLAETIYSLAARFGKANLYACRKIK